MVREVKTIERQSRVAFTSYCSWSKLDNGMEDCYRVKSDVCTRVDRAIKSETFCKATTGPCGNPIWVMIRADLTHVPRTREEEIAREELKHEPC